MTIKIYAERKNIPSESVRVDLEHDGENCADSGAASEENTRIVVIDSSIALRGTLRKSQKLNLIEIAHKWPVHGTLEDRIEVRTTHML